MDTEFHGTFSLLKLKAQGVECRIFVVLSLPDLTQPWKFLHAPLGSTVALTSGLDFPTSLTIPGVRGAAGGRQPAASKPPCSL